MSDTLLRLEDVNMQFGGVVAVGTVGGNFNFKFRNGLGG